MDQPRRQPAARDRDDVGEQIDGDERRADRREDAGIALRKQLEPLRLRKEIGKPEEEEIPDGVGEEFGGDEIPGLALAERLPPAERRAIGVFAILLDMRALGDRKRVV